MESWSVKERQKTVRRWKGKELLKLRALNTAGKNEKEARIWGSANVFPMIKHEKGR